MRWFILAQAVLMVWDYPLRPDTPEQGVAWQSMVCDAGGHFMYQTNCLMYGQAHVEVKNCEANLREAEADMPGLAYSCVWLSKRNLEGRFGQH